MEAKIFSTCLSCGAKTNNEYGDNNEHNCQATNQITSNLSEIPHKEKQQLLSKYQAQLSNAKLQSMQESKLTPKPNYALYIGLTIGIVALISILIYFLVKNNNKESNK